MLSIVPLYVQLASEFSVSITLVVASDGSGMTCTSDYTSTDERGDWLSALYHACSLSCLLCFICNLYHVCSVSYLLCIMSALYHVCSLSFLLCILSTISQITANRWVHGLRYRLKNVMDHDQILKNSIMITPWRSTSWSDPEEFHNEQNLKNYTMIRHLKTQSWSDPVKLHHDQTLENYIVIRPWKNPSWSKLKELHHDQTLNSCIMIKPWIT